MAADRINLFGIVKGGETADLLHLVISETPGFDLVIEQSGNREFTPDSVGELQNSVVILEVDCDDPTDINRFKALIGALGEASKVIVLSATASGDDVRFLLKSGAFDCLLPPFERRSITQALELARSELEMRTRLTSGRDGKTVSFIKSSGGIGATTILVNCAWQIDSMIHAQRREGVDMSCIDLDIQYGDITVNMDVLPESTLFNILEAPERLDANFLRGTMVEQSPGLHVLGAPKRIIPLEAMTPELAERLMKLVKRTYDLSLVDLPAAWTAWTETVLSSSELIVLCTQVTISGVNRARQQIDLLTDLGLETTPMIVIGGMYDKDQAGAERRKEAETALGRRFDLLIRPDSRVKVARDRGVAVRNVNSGTPFATDIERLSGAVLERTYPDWRYKEKGRRLPFIGRSGPPKEPAPTRKGRKRGGGRGRRRRAETGDGSPEGRPADSQRKMRGDG